MAKGRLNTDAVDLNVKVRVVERPHLEHEPQPYEARVVLTMGSLEVKEMHGGTGATPAEALLNAALHWYKHEQ